MRLGLAAWIAAFLPAVAHAQEPVPLPAPVYWFHVMHNTNNDQLNAKVYALMERAAKAGYTGLSLHDGRFIMKKFQTPEYIEKVHRFRAKAAELGLTIAVSLAPFGYGDEMMVNDVNLAEGMPVRGAVFLVKDGALVPHEPDLAVVNGGLEQWAGAKPVGWELDDAGTVCVRDEQVKSEGASSVRMDDIGSSQFKRTRLIQKIRVQPHRQYRLSAMIKTQDCTHKDLRLMALGKHPLNWTVLPIRETMDWTRISVTFNSQEFTEVGLYLGSWAGKTGRIWFDDIQVEPAGFNNIIRRESLPLTITSADGATVYEEGKDFSRVADALLTPIITAWHEPPKVTVPPGSRLKEGQEVRASFCHAMTNLAINNSAICMSEPAAYEAVRDQVRFIRQHVAPAYYFLGHDEIRLCGYDDTCAKRNLTPGQILADNIARCVAIVREIDPGKPVVVWSDMFDPHHNARKTDDAGAPFSMFLAKGDGPWWESWKGMPADLGVVNWNNGHVKSVEFFDGRGHRQVLSGNNPEKIVRWLEQTAHCRNVAGVMYTTWNDDWAPLEAYVEAARKAWAARAQTQPTTAGN